MGDVIGDINSRGEISGMEAISGAQQINYTVLLSEMFGYRFVLRSNTHRAGNTVWNQAITQNCPKALQKLLYQSSGNLK